MASTRTAPTAGTLALISRYQLKIELYQVNTDPEKTSEPCFFKKVIQLCLYKEENGGSLLIGKTAVLEIQTARKSSCVLPFREVFALTDLSDLRANLLVGGEMFGSCTLQFKEPLDGKAMRKRFRNPKGAVIATPYLSATIERLNEELTPAQLIPEIPFSDLTIGERIAKGAFGEVSKGKAGNTDVAIKKMLGELTEAAIEDFKAEMGILAGLRHPNILLLMGVCHHDDQVYMISELMEGDLAKLLLTRNEHQDEVKIGWAIEAAKGLELLHKRGILHRDIKPSNILYDKQMHIKVCDMGLARDASVTSSHTDAAGTPTYMAPEALQRMSMMLSNYAADTSSSGSSSSSASSSPASTKSDVYSFAITLWELIKGEHAFQDYLSGKKSPKDFFERVVRGGERPPLEEAWPRSFKTLLTSMWDPDPDRRPEIFPVTVRGETEPGVLQSLLNVKEHFHAKLLAKTINDKNGIVFWHRLTEKDQANSVPFAPFYYALFKELGRAVPLDKSIVVLEERDGQPVITPSVSDDQINEFLCRHPEYTFQQLKDARARAAPPASPSFPEAYAAQPTVSYVTPDERLLGALLEYLCGPRRDDSARVVTLEMFGRLIGQFGPLKYPWKSGVSTVLDRFEEVASKPYFFGFSRGMACDRDAFFLRCSIMSPHDLTFETRAKPRGAADHQYRKMLVQLREGVWNFLSGDQPLKHESINELLVAFFGTFFNFSEEEARSFVETKAQKNSPYARFFSESAYACPASSAYMDTGVLGPAYPN